MTEQGPNGFPEPRPASTEPSPWSAGAASPEPNPWSAGAANAAWTPPVPPQGPSQGPPPGPPAGTTTGMPWEPNPSSNQYVDPYATPGAGQWTPAGGPPPLFGSNEGASGPVALASWGSRAGALLLDTLFWLLTTIPLVIVIVLLIAVGPKRTYTGTDSYGEPSSWTGPSILSFIFMGLLLVVWWFAVSMFLYGHQQGRTGQSWGKKIAKIRVVDVNNGTPIGFWRSYGRWIVPQIINSFCGIFFIPDFLWPLWDPKKQSLHDKMFNTCVIKA